MNIVNHNTAGCYLIRHNETGTEILLIYNKWSDDNKGWVLPKGHVEEGETLEQAAVRETIEETGYQNIKIISPLKTLHIEYTWAEDNSLNKKDIHWFLAELVNDKKSKRNLTEGEKKREIRQKWVSLAEAYKLLKFDDEREILMSIM